MTIHLLPDHQTEIATKIEAGYAAAKQGKLMDIDAVRSVLQGRKQEWLADKRQA